MAIVEMQKVRLYVHKGHATPVMRAVQNLGLIEFVEVSDTTLPRSEKESFEFDYVSNRLDFAVGFLSQFTPEKGKLRQLIEGTKIDTTEDEIAETAQSFYFNDIVDSLQSLEEKLNDTKTKIRTLSEECALLSEWRAIDVPLGGGLETKHTYTLLVEGRTEEVALFVDEIKEKDIAHAVLMHEGTRAGLVFFKDDTIAIKNILVSHKLSVVTLPRRRGTPNEELERMERAHNKALKEQAHLEDEVRKLLPSLPKLKMVADHMYWKKQKHDLTSEAANTKGVLVFEGWAPKKKLALLEETIAKETPFFALETTEPNDGESVPVEIENNRFIKPFESVTRLYGLPTHKDIDPTVFLAGFFFVFFGLCLTDVGYGVFLALVTGLAMVFFKLPKDMKPFVLLLMFGGIASALIGLLFGGYLGIDPSHLPTWLQAIQKFDPVGNPIPVFYLALALGVLQTMFGIGLKIYSEARNHNFVGAALDHMPWLLLFVSLGVWGGEKLSYIHVSTVWFVYASLGAIVLTSARHGTNIFSKLLKGFMGLYDGVGYFSDILSYSRLLALGLATSALAFAINLIAGLIGGMIPYVGPVIAVLILIVGHLFNLAVNTLGAFIHSARLQFVEFFGKFIGGTGKTFQPFKRTERFVTIK